MGKQYRKDKKFMKSHKSSTIIMNRNKKLFFTSKVKQNMLAQFNSLSKNKSIKDKKKLNFLHFLFDEKKKKRKQKHEFLIENLIDAQVICIYELLKDVSVFFLLNFHSINLIFLNVKKVINVLEELNNDDAVLSVLKKKNIE